MSRPSFTRAVGIPAAFFFCLAARFRALVKTPSRRARIPCGISPPVRPAAGSADGRRHGGGRGFVEADCQRAGRAQIPPLEKLEEKRQKNRKAKIATAYVSLLFTRFPRFLRVGTIPPTPHALGGGKDCEAGNSFLSSIGPSLRLRFHFTPVRSFTPWQDGYSASRSRPPFRGEADRCQYGHCPCLTNSKFLGTCQVLIFRIPSRKIFMLQEEEKRSGKHAHQRRDARL